MKKVDVQYAIEAIENISLHNRWDRDLYGEKVHKTVEIIENKLKEIENNDKTTSN